MNDKTPPPRLQIRDVNGVESPCVDICVIDPSSRLCLGCLRSIDEIAAWGSLTPEARREIMAGLENRRPLTQTRKGGRAARLKRRG